MFVEEKAKGEIRELDAPAMALLRAASWLEKHGLCREVTADAQGRGCVIHALYQHNLSFPDDIRIAQERLTKDIGTNIVMWLLFTNVSQDEVIAKLRAVAFSS